MRQIREVLRLRFASELPQRAIAKSLGLSQGAVSGYLSRARAAGVRWPLPADLDDVQLEVLLFPPPPTVAADQRPMPDWAWVHRELRRPDVTLALLWEEYRAGAPDGFGYSWFCDLYRGWAGRLKPTMRQTHIAGEKLFVDFAGRTGEVVDGLTGEIVPVQIFVAVLGASNFTYAEAVWSQKLPDWKQSIWKMRVLGFNDNQGRASSDDGWIEHQIDQQNHDRYIAYVADSPGSAPESGERQQGRAKRHLTHRRSGARPGRFRLGAGRRCFRPRLVDQWSQRFNIKGCIYHLPVSAASVLRVSTRNSWVTTMISNGAPSREGRGSFACLRVSL